MHYLRPSFLLFALLIVFTSKAQDRFPKIEYDKDYNYIYLDSAGNQIGEAYSRAEPFFRGIAVVVKGKMDDQRMGVIDNKGKYIVPLGNYFIQNLTNGLVVVSEPKGKNTVYNSNGKATHQCMGCIIERVKDRPYFLSKPNMYERSETPELKVSVLDSTGKALFTMDGSGIEAARNFVSKAREESRTKDLALFQVLKPTTEAQWYYALVRANGTVLLDSISAINFINGLAVVTKGKSAALIDTTGKQIIGFDKGYEYGQVLQDHPQQGICFKKAGKFGVVDITNKVLVPFVWKGDINYSAHEHYYKTANEAQDSTYLLTLGLDTISSPDIYTSPRIYPPKLEAPVISKKQGATQDKYGYRNAKGKIVIPFLYDFLSEAKHDSILFYKKDTAGFLSTSGKRLFTFPVPCYAASWFSKNKAWYVSSIDSTSKQVMDQGGMHIAKFGLVSSKGQTLTPANFEYVSPFLKGRSLVKGGKDWFTVDSLYRRIKYQDKYDYVSNFKNDIAFVSDGKHYGAVHRNGTLVVPVEYDEFSTDNAINWYEDETQRPEFFSYINRQGEESMVPAAPIVPAFVDGKLEGKKNGNRFLFDISLVNQSKAEVLSDSLSQWYTVNPIFTRSKSGYEERYKLPESPVVDSVFTLLPVRKNEFYTLINKTTSKQVSNKVFDEVVTINRYGAIVKSSNLYSFVNNEGKIILNSYSKIQWDNGLLHAYNAGAFADGLPPENSTCIKSEFYDTKFRKKFEVLWHDHADFLQDSIAYFRFGRMLSIIGKSGKVYVKERLENGRPFKGICNDNLVYAMTEVDKVVWKVYDVFKKPGFSILNQSSNMVIGPYKINDTLFGYYDTYGVKYFLNSKGQDLPYYLEPDQMQKDEQWGTYFNQDNFIVKNKTTQLFGLLSKTGKWLLPCEYKALQSFEKGYALCLNAKDELTLINESGKAIKSNLNREDFELLSLTGEAYTFYDGWIVSVYSALAEGPVSLKDEDNLRRKQYCYSDLSGKNKLCLPAKYILVGNFHEGLAAVVDQNLKIGFVDKSGKEVIPCLYNFEVYADTLPRFKGGFAYIQSAKGCIDKKGKAYFDVELPENPYGR